MGWAQGGATGGGTDNTGGFPTPRPEIRSPESSTLIQLFNLDQVSEEPWIVRLLGAGAALVLVILGSLLLRRVIALGTAHSRGINEFEQLISRLIRWIYWPLSAVFIVQQAGVYLGSIWSFLATAIALVALGLIAVWAIPSNSTAAVVILSSRFFKVGDHVEIGDGEMGAGLRGICRDIGLIYTTLEVDAPNRKGSILARIPNNTIFQKHVLVYREGALPKAEKEADGEKDKGDDKD
jgi:small-conductance mechanosensitive channel